MGYNSENRGCKGGRYSQEEVGKINAWQAYCLMKQDQKGRPEPIPGIKTLVLEAYVGGGIGKAKDVFDRLNDERFNNAYDIRNVC